MTAKTWERWLPLCVAALVLALFARAVGYTFVLWDDPPYIRDNPLVQPQIPWPPDGVFTPALGYPIPVTIGLYRLVALAAGVTPGAFHALNVLLHAVNVALLFALLRRTATLPVAWLGTLLWAVHPLVVEPVSWCTGTKDLLYALGFLVTLHAALAVERVPPWLLLVGLAAMLAKPTAVVLPVVLLWSVVALHGREGLKRPGLPLAVVVLGALAAAVVGAGLVVAHNAGPDGYGTIDQTPVGALERLAAVLQALDLQLRHVVWPVDLLPQYFRLVDLQWRDPPFVRGVVWLTLLLALAVWTWRAEDRRLRWWLGLAAITYLPVSMLLPINRFTCDSYAYVPLLCLAAFVATWAESRLAARPVQGLAVAACGTLVVLSALQQPMWADSLALWGRNVAADPHRPLLIKRYAESVDDAGRHDEAYRYLRTQLRDLQRARSVDGFVLAMFADRAPVDEARALYAWAYAQEPDLRPDAHRNFCTFVVKQQLQLTPAERTNLARALDALRRHHARQGEVDALLALASLGAAQHLWAETGALMEHAWLLAHNPAYAQAAASAYQNAGDTESLARLQTQLTPQK